MKEAPWLIVDAPIEARARYLARAYHAVLADHDALTQPRSGLRQHRGHEVVDHWVSLSAAGNRLALCRALVEQHYDPAYVKAMRVLAPRILLRLQAPDLTEAALDRLADDLDSVIQRIELDPGGSLVIHPISAAS